MSEGFEKLKSIGAQKIHEKTHIAKHHVQALLHESFDEMTKVQFIGFISILEREYTFRLPDLRERGLEHFKGLSKSFEEESQVFFTPKKKKNNTFLYILLALILLISGIIYNNLNHEKSLDEQNATYEELQIQEKEIEEIPEIFEENNTTNELINIQESNATQETQELVVLEKSLVIVPRTRLWIGYINTNTHQKYQKTITEPLEFDGEKDWLLYLGHGNIEIVLHGETIGYKKADNMRFSYQDGELKEIDLQEFKSLNRGNKW